MPSGGSPSITPITPRPWSVSATITSTGLPVAQKMRHTSGTSLHRAQHVDREQLPQQDQKDVPGADGLDVLRRQLAQLLVGAAVPHEAIAGGLAEGESELRRRGPR